MTEVLSFISLNRLNSSKCILDDYEKRPEDIPNLNEEEMKKMVDIYWHYYEKILIDIQIERKKLIRTIVATCHYGEKMNSLKWI